MLKGQGCPEQIPLSPRGISLTAQHSCQAQVQHRAGAAGHCVLSSLRGRSLSSSFILGPQGCQWLHTTTYPLQSPQQIKLTKLTPILFFLYFLPGFLLLLLLSVSGGLAWKKLSFYDEICGSRWGSDSAENWTNGQEQLVLLLTVHTLLNTILSHPSFMRHTHKHLLHPTLNSHLANKLFNYSIPQGRQWSFQMQLPARLSHTRNGLIG